MNSAVAPLELTASMFAPHFRSCSPVCLCPYQKPIGSCVGEGEGEVEGEGRGLDDASTISRRPEFRGALDALMQRLYKASPNKKNKLEQKSEEGREGGRER